MDATRTQAAPGRDDPDGRGQLVGIHPELGSGRADREPRMRLGRHLGVEPQEHVEGAVADAGVGDLHQGPGLVRRFDRDPARGVAAPGRPHDGPEIVVGLADPLDRHAVVRESRLSTRWPTHRGRRRSRRSRGAEARRDRGDVVGLQRIGAQPGIGKRGGDPAAAVREGRDIGDGDRRAEAMAGQPEGGRDLRQPVHEARRRPSARR